MNILIKFEMNKKNTNFFNLGEVFSFCLVEDFCLMESVEMSSSYLA